MSVSGRVCVCVRYVLFRYGGFNPMRVCGVFCVVFLEYGVFVWCVVWCVCGV